MPLDQNAMKGILSGNLTSMKPLDRRLWFDQRRTALKALLAKYNERRW